MGERNQTVFFRAALTVATLTLAWPTRLPAAEPAVSRAAFAGQVGDAQNRVRACAVTAAACQTSALPPEERVAQDGSHPGFPVSWDWLANSLESAQTAKAADRVAAMHAAQGHLEEWAAEAADAAPAADASRYGQARAAATAVLSGDEFRTATEGPTWWDRMVARIEDWLFRLLFGMGRVTGRHPWLAPLIEWSCFLLAAGGLVFSVRRSLGRQALRLAVGDGAARAQRTGRDTADWERLAGERSAAGDWREAIHCLYWAAIASLEARRAWRPNPTRTPREYLPLLPPGSDAQRALRDLTRALERLWYGHGNASEADFRAAQEQFAAVAAADPRKGDAAAPPSVARATAGSA